jgi:hypothetical protein
MISSSVKEVRGGGEGICNVVSGMEYLQSEDGEPFAPRTIALENIGF